MILTRYQFIQKYLGKNFLLKFLLESMILLLLYFLILANYFISPWGTVFCLTTISLWSYDLIELTNDIFLVNKLYAKYKVGQL